MKVISAIEEIIDQYHLKSGYLPDNGYIHTKLKEKLFKEITKDLILPLFNFNSPIINLYGVNFQFHEQKAINLAYLNNTINIHQQIFYLNLDINESNNVCTHKWVQYRGFREDYEFCEICDQKRDLIRF